MLFWNYSNKVYRIDGVPRSCLELQNQFGLDVNLVLFCYWYATAYGVIDNHLFNQILEFSHTWSGNTVKPLRKMRSWLKDTGCTQSYFDSDTCMNYRDRIKALELEAEKIQQMTLESYCQADTRMDKSVQQSCEAAALNLKNYLAAENIKSTDELINELEFINKASFETSDAGPFRKILKQ